MTKQERIALVQHLTETRPGPRAEFVPPEKYQLFVDDTTVEMRDIETSAGATRIWLVDKKVRQKPSAVFVNIHGGGFVAPHMERDIFFSQRIASEVGILVVDISYRTTLDAEFPVACYESYDCVKWVYDHAQELDIDVNKIMVGGHSAGANLTAAVSILAKEKQEFTVALQVLDYPPLDFVTDPSEKPDNDKTLVSPERSRNFSILYLGNQENAKNILASPIFATTDQLSGLPEAVVITAGNDNLRFEAEKYSSKLIEAGVTVHAKRFVHSGHGFVIGCADEYDQAIWFMEDCMRRIIERGVLSIKSTGCSDNTGVE